MEVIIVANDRHHGTRTFTFSGDKCHIGRAFDNDIVLMDAQHVSPYHAVLEEDFEGKWLLEDKRSKNGIRNRKNKRLSSPVAVNSGDELVLGRVRLRFFHPEHTVTEATEINALDAFLQRVSHPALSIAFGFLITLLLAGLSYMEYYTEFEWKDFLFDSAMAPLTLLGWAGAWAFIGKLLRHEMRFFEHFLVAMFFLLLSTLLDLITDNIAFNWPSLSWLGYASDIVYAVLVGLLLGTHLMLATNLSKLKRRSAAFGVSAVVLGAVFLSSMLQEDEFESRPVYNSVMQVPAVLWRDGVSVDEYIETSARLFDEIAIDDNDSAGSAHSE